MNEHEVWKSWPLPPAGTALDEWQAGRCAWCGDDRERLVSDHCHMTGFVRGLLCRGCNVKEGTAIDPRWNPWRDGDTPARAIGHVEVYVGWRGTPLWPTSPLIYYTAEEQHAWWDSCVAAGELPVEVPWSEQAAARKKSDMDAMREAGKRIDALIFGRAT